MINTSSNGDIHVRLAELNDQQTLITFNAAMALETESKQLDNAVLERGVTTVLRGKANAFYLLASDNQQDIGSLMITEEWSDWRAKTIWWIQSVYVLPSHRRRGVFSTLFNTLTSMAKNNGDIGGFRLYVEKDNTIAQQTYQSLGFIDSGYFLLERLSTNE